MTHDNPVLVAVANASLIQAPPPAPERVIATIDGGDFPGMLLVDWNRPWEAGHFYPDHGTGRIERFWPTQIAGGEYSPVRAALRPEANDAWAIEASIFSGGFDDHGSYVRAYIRFAEKKPSAPVAYIRLLFRGQQIQSMPQRFRRDLGDGKIRFDANAHLKCGAVNSGRNV